MNELYARPGVLEENCDTGISNKVNDTVILRVASSGIAARLIPNSIQVLLFQVALFASNVIE